MTGDWRPKPERPRKKKVKPAPEPRAPELPAEPAAEWRPHDVAPAGKFRVVTFGRVGFDNPTSTPVGDYDSLPFAKQHAIELNRTANLKTKGSPRLAWVLNDAGGIEFNPYATVSHRRPLAVTSIAGTSREESRKPVKPIKRK